MTPGWPQVWISLISLENYNYAVADTSIQKAFCTSVRTRVRFSGTTSDGAASSWTTAVAARVTLVFRITGCQKVNASSK